MRYRLLGTVQVTTADGRPAALGGYRQRLVLAVLLLQANRTVATTRLIAQVWGEEPPPTARRTLQAYISRLRGVLGTEELTGSGDGYGLWAPADEIDATRFAAAAAEGKRLLESDPAAAAVRLRGALALWRGAPWGELADEPALRADADRLWELRLVATEDRIAADIACGDGDGLVPELRGLVSEHPLRERLRALLMVALHRGGQTAEALAVFEDGRQLLVERLGADPGPELARVHERILRRDRSLNPAPERRVDALCDPPAPNPYKGLRAFDEEDADTFHGRRRLVAELVEVVATRPFVAIVGPSGSGKSSVVRAGLVPALRHASDDAAEPRILAMVPGAHPFVEFDAAVANARDEAGAGTFAPRGDDLDVLRTVVGLVQHDHGRVVLIVDQFEELFLQAADDERERFVRNLVEAVEDPHSRLSVVAVLRADLLDRAMADARLGGLVMDNLVHVPPLAPAELEAACVLPARRVGVTVEPDLTAELVADVARRPGALPLFQYTLTDLFEHRAGAAMTLDDHRRLGGLDGVIARRAEDTFAALSSPQRRACRQLLLRLVAIDDDGAPGRRRVTRAELAALPVAAGEMDAVLDHFSAARLLTLDRSAASGEATVEVAHEAVLREWPRLRTIIDDAREDLRIQRWVAAAAAEWGTSGRADDHLLSGARLDAAREWRDRTLAAPTSRELAFVDASLARREAQRREERQRHRRERAMARRLRRLVAVLAVVALVAATLGGTALVQRSRAEGHAAELASTVQLERARTLANSAVVHRRLDPQRSLSLALHAVAMVAETGTAVPRELVEALHWALQAARVPYPDLHDLRFADELYEPIDGMRIVGAISPQGVQTFSEMPMEELYAHARAAVTRDLTMSECRDAFGLSVCPDLPEDLPGVVSEALWKSRTGRGGLWGTQVTVATSTLGEDADGLRAEFSRLSDRFGIEVVLTDATDLDALVRERLLEHQPPDIVVFGEIAPMLSLARQGALMDLSRYIDPHELQAAFSPHLVSLATIGPDGAWPSGAGALYGIPLGLVNKSLIWYSTDVFGEHGYEPPRTYDELLHLTERMAADGLDPWCSGERFGASARWPVPGVIENLLLQSSVDDYDAWLAHHLTFDDPPLRRALDRRNQLLAAARDVEAALEPPSVHRGEPAADPLHAEPPRCALSAMSSAEAARHPVATTVGRDVGVFPFPPVEGHPPMILGSGRYAAALTDRPEVWQVMRYVASSEFGSQWAPTSAGYLSPRRDVAADAYGCDDEATNVACVTDAFGASLAASLSAALERDAVRLTGSESLP